MFRRRTCTILREPKVSDEICLRYVMGAKDSQGGCRVLYVQSAEDTQHDARYLQHVGAALIF
jgi:hypothetical protein